MKSLHDALTSLSFAHKDTVLSSQNFSMFPIPTAYLEPEAPIRAQWAWADGPLTPFHSHSYLFATTDTADHSNRIGRLASVACVPNGSAPPLGMRSAPPLGGLAAGTVELRADGTLQAWTVENASPAGSTKIATLPDAVIGLRAAGVSRLLQTHPAAGMPGVDAIEFSGAMPFTRLIPRDVTSFPPEFNLQLFGRSKWKVGDMTASATPSLAFTLTATNPRRFKPMEISLFFSLPLSLQPGVSRAPGTQTLVGAEQHTLPVTSASTPESCFKACASAPRCAAWHFSPSKGCVAHLNDTLIPPARNSVEPGVASGVRGTWRHGRQPECLTLERKGSHAAAGSATLCGSAEEESNGATSVTLATAMRLADLWDDFAADGRLNGNVDADAAIGAMAVQLSLPPLSNGSVSISFGWYFPYRDWMGSSLVGNHYTSLFTDAEDAASVLTDSRAAALDVSEWSAFSDTLIGPHSSVPDWLADALLNSLHHTRSAMWLAGGRWRQWESFSCVNVDSVHNDGERHLPYMMLWPDTVPSKMRAWGAGQLSNGMIQEQLACGCADATPPELDRPCGRVMGDVSSMYATYLYELWIWTANSSLVKELWPYARRAAEWQMGRAASGGGLPNFLVDTYDGLELNLYNVSAFSAFFHLLAMRAAEELALSPAVNDPSFAQRCRKAFHLGQQAIQRELWNASAGYYRSYSGGHAVMADSLYAQVLADSLGLGPLTSDAQVRSHLATVLKLNSSPYGLLIQTGRDGHSVDNTVWMMANANVATLLLWRGEAPLKALAVAEVMLSWWRSHLKDLWNVVAINIGVGGGQDKQCAGHPWANSHYGYYMVAWHLLLALSQQAWNAPQLSLRLAPRLTPPYQLPVLVPRTSAQITAEFNPRHSVAGKAVRYTFSVIAGVPLTLNSLHVHGSAPECPWPCALRAGDSISWLGIVEGAA